MEFGRQGKHRILVNGLPFRADGDTYEEAQQKVYEMLNAAPELFDQRAKDLGADADTLEALRLAAEKGSTTVGDTAFMEANKGRVRQDQMGTGWQRFWTGMGRGMVNRSKGAGQALTNLFGYEQAGKAIEESDREERQLYEQLDKAGFGPEDLGEIGADIAAVAGITTLAAPAAAAAGVSATGAVPLMLIGAGLAASDVKDPGQGRMVDMALGAAGGAAGPLLRGAGQAAGAIGKAVSPSVITKLSPGLFLRFRALMGNREALAKVIQDGLSYTEPGVDKAKQIVGRAALDTVQKIAAALPADAARGLKDPAGLAVIRGAVAKSTQTTAEGVNVFNPAEFEKHASTLIGQLGNVFAKPEQRVLAASLGKISRIMQTLPTSVSPQAAERAAAALALASPRDTDAIVKALQLATNPGAKQALFDSLVNQGGSAIKSAVGDFAIAAPTGAGENVLTEGTEDMGEVLGGRQQARQP